MRSYDVDVRADWADEDRQIDDRRGVGLRESDGEEFPFEEAIEEAEVAYVTGATSGLSTSLAAATARLLKMATEAGALTAFGLCYDPGQ